MGFWFATILSILDTFSSFAGFASPTIWFYLSSNHCALSAKNVQSNNPNIKHNIKQWAGIDFKQTASNSKDSTRDCHRRNNIQQPSPQPKQQLEDI